MTTLKDTQEDWNLIDAAPYELHKLIVLRNNTWFTGKNGFQRSWQGAFYCLSIGIEKSKWDKVKSWEDFADIGTVTGAMGLRQPIILTIIGPLCLSPTTAFRRRMYRFISRANWKLFAL